MEGRLINGRIRTEFVPFACRSYQQLVMTLHEETTDISGRSGKIPRFSAEEEGISQDHSSGNGVRRIFF